MGAPAADSRQPGVYRGGAVYKCRPDSPRSCEIIPFDTEGEKSKSEKINIFPDAMEIPTNKLNVSLSYAVILRCTFSNVEI